MKKQILIFAILLAPLMHGCGDWLDVGASTDVDRTDLVSSDEGFKQMLYGVYLNMTGADLYGTQLSFGMIEGCAANYTYSSSFSKWDYTASDARPTIDAVWAGMYNTVANINSILKDIDNGRELFTGGEWALLKGEALALRAFLHFDLLRMFAPNYVGNEDRTAIPYVLGYGRVRYPHVSARRVMEYIGTDLTDAEALLREAGDPALTGIVDSRASKGIFTANRRYRMNYWAVRALQARVALYAGQTAEAARHASDVLSSGVFEWVDPEGFSASRPDRVMLSEVIFALDLQGLSDYNTRYFKSGLYSMADSYSDYTTKNLFDDTNDYRYLYLMMNDADGRRAVPARYNQAESPAADDILKLPTLPLIRMGEMQLILAECRAATDLPEAIRLVRELRLHRGYLAADRSIADGTSTDELKAIIVKEMRKETHMEGQTFFTYKRCNLTAIPAYNPWMAGATNPMKIENYTLPLPEDEKEWGNIPKTDN